MTPEERARLVAVARGSAAPDLVIEGARVFSAYTREWLDGDVAVAGGRIAGVGAYPGGERLDAGGRWLVPGFIDAHVHLESSKLTPAEFARTVLPRGTTAVVCDPHEIGNVLGVEGIRWLLDAAAAVPLDVFAMAPSCVPASPLESPRAPLGPAEMEALLRDPRTLGVAEMMDFPSVVAGRPEVLAKLDLPGGEHVDGHAPGVSGRELNAYVAAGPRSDHEATTYEEALEKRRAGMWVLLREASNARNVRDLLPLVRDHGPAWCAFCTDDREPEALLRGGHIDLCCRLAVQAGIPPEDALLLAGLHAARVHGLLDRGAIAPGHRADLLLLDDLETFLPQRVLKDGRVVVEDGRVAPFPASPVPDWLRNTINLAPLDVADLALPEAGGPLRVIEIVPGQLLTLARSAASPREPGLAKLAVVERHHATGRVGVGLVRGFGLEAGAFATTVAHDAHNVVAVGMDDGDILACVTRLAELGGGVVVASGGEVRAELALPLAGLLSDAPVEAVVADVDAVHAALHALGCRVESPLMTLSFLALSVIPELKLTDRGLVDVVAGRVVPLAL